MPVVFEEDIFLIDGQVTSLENGCFSLEFKNTQFHARKTEI